MLDSIAAFGAVVDQATAAHSSHALGLDAGKHILEWHLECVAPLYSPVECQWIGAALA